MKPLFKTLFGDRRTIAVAAASLLVTALVLYSPAAAFAGAVLPVCLLGGAAYLARH